MKNSTITLTSNDKEFYARKDKDLFYVYYIICKITNRKYIGAKVTRNIDVLKLRRDPLIDRYLGSSEELTNDIEKARADGLLVNEIVEKFIICTARSIDELEQMEKDMILYYNAVEDPTFYNKHYGGNGLRSYTTSKSRKGKKQTQKSITAAQSTKEWWIKSGYESKEYCEQSGGKRKSGKRTNMKHSKVYEIALFKNDEFIGNFPNQNETSNYLDNELELKKSKNGSSKSKYYVSKMVNGVQKISKRYDPYTCIKVDGINNQYIDRIEI